MHTNIDLDPELVATAQKVTGIKSKRALIHEALRQLVETAQRPNLLDLEGRFEFAPGYDHKAARSEAAPMTAT